MNPEREQLFGSDIRIEDCASGLDFILNSRGDISIADGIDNVRQALILRLRVRKGELARIGWPDYGSRLHELIGEPNNTRTHLKLMAFARSAVEADPRVAEVENVSTQVLPGERDVVRVIMEIRLIDQPNPISLVIDLAL